MQEIDYPYEENGLIYFNEDTIVEQFAYTTWNGFYKVENQKRKHSL